jgi:uncharacterized protein YcbK (DUF882 family)
VRAAALLLVLLASTAYAHQATKQPAAPVPPAERAAYDKKLDKQITLAKKPEPIVNLHNIWTHETLVLDAKKGTTVDDVTLDHFLRCHATNEPTRMDPRLVGVLIGAAVRFKTEKIEIVSGFRSPKFNLSLRKKGHEVARDSQHTHGHAVDFRIPGVSTVALLRFVKGLSLGGAGYYPESEFVHADTGPVRYWTGR